MKKFIISLAVLPALFFSCSSDDDTNTEAENEEELITDLIVNLTSEDGTETLQFTATDTDGDSVLDGIDDMILSPNTTYSGVIDLLNGDEDVIEEDISEELEEHQFFYTSSDDLNITTEYDDEDADGYPVGIEFTLITEDASTGTLTVLLLHEPDKTAEGVEDGDPTNAEGETDVEVTFDVTIE